MSWLGSGQTKRARQRLVWRQSSPDVTKAIRKRYSSDLTDSQRQRIKPLFNWQRKRKYDLRRDILDAIFYLVKTGCQGHMLPESFAPLLYLFPFICSAATLMHWDLGQWLCNVCEEEIGSFDPEKKLFRLEVEGPEVVRCLPGAHPFH